MRHQYFGMNGFAGFGFILLIIAVIVAAVLIYIWVKRSNMKTVNGLSAIQKDSMEKFSSLVLAMITQHGKGLSQIEISGNLNMPVDVVSEKLLEMEKEGLITRKWLNDEYTYIIKKSNK